MPNPLIQKLEHGAQLSDDDRQVLEQVVHDVRDVGARQDIIEEGDKPNHVHAIIEGFACRYKLLSRGERQIMAWLVPGDICDLHIAILGDMDHAIGTLAPCKIAYIGRDTIEELTTRHPAINRALWWATLVDEGTLREWLVSMGRRAADKQMAHLFCELFTRLQTVGLTNGNGFDFPLTQEELADTLGVSNVHVNRMLQELRDYGLITLKGRTLTIPDFERLSEFADFDPNYLHLKNSRRNGKAAETAAGGEGTPVGAKLPG
jgi:CRP-like cAMP-binding protein